MDTRPLEHLFSFVGDHDLERCLEAWIAAGFLRNTGTVRQARGIRSGFLSLTSGYLELMAVEDPQAFADGAEPFEVSASTSPRPHGLVVLAADPAAAWRSLSEELPDTPLDYTHQPAGRDPGDPSWHFVHPRIEATPGIDVLGIRYLRRDPATELRHGPNTIHAIDELVLCSSTPASWARRWGATLTALGHAPSVHGGVVTIGPQRVRFVTPEACGVRLGRPWRARDPRHGAFASLGLAALDAAHAAHLLSEAGFEVLQGNTPWPILGCPWTGFVLELRQRAPEAWR